MQYVNIFKIHDYNGQLSDHCKISTQIRGNPQLSERYQNRPSVNTTQTKGHVGYRWGGESDAAHFLDQINSQQFRHKFNDITVNISRKTINESITQLNGIL